MAVRHAFVMESQSSHTQGDCFQSLLSEIAEIKLWFKPSLHDSQNQVASALRLLFKLTWLPFLVHAGTGNKGIESVRNKNPKRWCICKIENERSPWSDNTDNSSPAKHVGDEFFQALACNFEPQNQTSERHAVEKFLNKAAFPRKRHSPEHFKNKILRDLFILSNIAIP